MYIGVLSKYFEVGGIKNWLKSSVFRYTILDIFKLILLLDVTWLPYLLTA
jgi:hypothetical protein